MVLNSNRSECEACPAGAEPLANKTACVACAPGGYSTNNGFCHSCGQSEYCNTERSGRRAHADSERPGGEGVAAPGLAACRARRGRS